MLKIFKIITGWIIETINPNFKKRIIYGYNSSNKTATLSSDFTSPTTTLTQYKLTEGHFSGLSNINNVRNYEQ